MVTQSANDSTKHERWDHRVVMWTKAAFTWEGIDFPEKTWFAIHVVWYVNDKPSAWAPDPATVMSDKSAFELHATLTKMRLAMNKPVLIASEHGWTK